MSAHAASKRRGRSEPIWLQRDVVEAIHDELLMEHGGLAGIRDPGLLESALARPGNQWHDRPAVSLGACAAAYGFGLARNHPFNDGNKRTAFQATYVFLVLNGRSLVASEVDAVATMLGVADGSVSEANLARWLTVNSGARKRRT